jgi:hypothetical protein
VGTYMMFLDCPEYMDKQCAVRCGLPAEVLYRYDVTSTDGPLESAKISCPLGHWFNGPIESLSWDKHPDATYHTNGVHSHDVVSTSAREGRAD